VNKVAIFSPTPAKNKEGGAPLKRVDDFQTIDFYGDLIPLLKFKYSVAQGQQPAEASKICKVEIQN
jgi:hypothetical protein